MSETGRLEIEKQAFLASAAHELKNPLTCIIGFLEMLQETNMSSVRRQRCLSICYAESQRMLRMLEAISLSDKLDSACVPISLVPHVLDHLLRTAVEKYAELYSDRSFSLILKDKNVTAVYDEILLSQAIDNLLSNAVKYSGNGGIITVTQETKDQKALVSVADNGIGIADAHIPLIFDKYYRVGDTHSDHISGLGLGLANTRRILEEHGGSIWVESKLGKGTVFFFSLPLQAQL